jgi:hypothetical protein
VSPSAEKETLPLPELNKTEECVSLSVPVEDPVKT